MAVTDDSCLASTQLIIRVDLRSSCSCSHQNNVKTLRGFLFWCNRESSTCLQHCSCAAVTTKRCIDIVCPLASKPMPCFQVVQGYKFNIFYPDLIDKLEAPTYSLEKDPGADEHGSTCMLRYSLLICLFVLTSTIMQNACWLGSGCLQVRFQSR